MRRISLWALPDESDATPFAGVSARLASAVGSAPVPPHITVIGSTGDELPDLIDAFRVTLVALADSATPRRCITVTAEPAAPLLALRNGIGEVYEPHLSLLYGELPADRRAGLRDSVTLELPRTITIDALSLVDTSDDDHTKWVELRRLPLRTVG